MSAEHMARPGISAAMAEYRDNGMAYGKRLIDMAAVLGSPYGRPDVCCRGKDASC